MMPKALGTLGPHLKGGLRVPEFFPERRKHIYLNESESVSAQSCQILCHPMNYIPSGSSVHGILQARILERIAIPSPGDIYLNEKVVNEEGYLYCLFGFVFLSTRKSTVRVRKSNSVLRKNTFDKSPNYSNILT